jgi:ketosteroid isomerase-like protein
MSRENVELVLSQYDAIQRGDYTSPLDAWADDLVWDMTGFGLPDMAKVYRGREGLIEFWVAWLTAWDALEFETHVVEDPEDHVIVEVKQRNRGRASGVAVDFNYFQAFTLRDGRIVASYMADSRLGALAAVGLAK